MRKFLKIIAVLAVIVIVLVGIASIALRVLLPPEKAKALVLKQLTTHLKREVRIGEVSVGVVTGLSVSDLKVSESPNFSKGTFLSSDQFSLRLALLPLLFRKIEVRQLVLTHPVVQIVRYQDGKTFNFSDLVPATPTKTAAMGAVPGLIPDAYAAGPGGAESAGSEPSLSLVISNAQIQDGVLHFIDHSAAKQSLDISALDLKLKNVSLTSPFSVVCSLKAAAKGVEASLQLSAEADLASESVKIKTCQLSSAGSTVLLSGNATQLKSSHPSVDLSLQIKQFNPATLNAFVTLPPTVKLAGPITGDAHVKGDDKSMNLAANIGLGALKASAHGEVQGATSTEPSINLHVETNDFPVSELAQWVPGAIPKTITLAGQARISADVSGTQMSSRIAAKLEAANMSIAMDAQFKKPAGVPLDASLIGEWVQPPSAMGTVPKGRAGTAPRTGAAPTLTLQSLVANLGPIHLQGNGSYHASANPQMSLNLKSNAWPVQEAAAWVPALAPYKPAGMVSMDVRASGSPSSPMANGTVSLQNVSAHYQQSDLTGISSIVNFTQQDVGIPKLTGKLNGSDFSLKLTAHKLNTQPDINVESNIALLDLDKLLPPSPAAQTPTQGSDPMSALGLTPAIVWAAEPAGAKPEFMPSKIVAHLSAGQIKHELYQAQNLDFKCNLTDLTPDLSRVNGTANLKQGAGKLNNVEKLASVSKTARIALEPIVVIQRLDKDGLLQKMGVPSLQSIPFDSIMGDYVMRSGIMTIRNFALAGHDLNLQTNGTAGLAGDQLLDLKVVIKLAAGLIRGAVGDILQDENGRATLPFSVTGPASHPTVVPDLREAGQRALQKFGGDLLKNLGVGSAPASPSNAVPSNNNGSSNSAPPPQQQDNPADQLQKALKNIFH